MTGKDYKIPLLMDYYGKFLSKTQYDNLDYYYNQDLSLAEISDNTSKSRQGVLSSIKKAESILYDVENKLGLTKKLSEIKAYANKIMDIAKNIKNCSENLKISGEIDAYISKILKISDKL